MDKYFTKWLRKGLLVCAIWLLIALLISSITFLNQIQGYSSKNLAPWDVILVEIICITPWIISTPLIVWVVRNYRLEKDHITRSLPIHILTALFVFIFHSSVQSYVISFYYDHPFSAYLMTDFVGYMDMRLILYAGVVLGVYALDFNKKNREIKMREPRLRVQLSKNRYRAILNQIQPDFLLASIDVIREKIKSSPCESEETLTDFSDLLRIMLQNTNREEVSVREDREAYYLYMKLLEKRLGRAIDVKTDIQEDCYEALVPSFLMLIPLCEEVLSIDGEAPSAIRATSYRAMREKNTLYLETTITGIKKSSGEWDEHLRNIRFREITQHLQSMYAEPISFEALARSADIQINLCLPFNRSEDNIPGGGFIYNIHPT